MNDYYSLWKGIEHMQIMMAEIPKQSVNHEKLERYTLLYVPSLFMTYLLDFEPEPNIKQKNPVYIRYINRRHQMSYTCQNCGVTADNNSDLCNPTSEKLDTRFCGASSIQICDGKLPSMQYSCDACGSVSADAEHLCNPSKIR